MPSTPPSPAPDADPRLSELAVWLEGAVPDTAFTLAPASADASFRRYFRLQAPGRSWIAMDAPPPQEDCRPFVRVAALLREAGVNAPEVLAEDLDRGFLLLSDLGNVTYLSVLDADRADPLYLDAIDALIRWQCASRPGVLPEYDAALLGRETALFPEWYLGRHRALTLTAGEQEGLQRSFAAVIAHNLREPRVYVHRDYHSRNLMASDPNPGVIDFQDAVYGPISYDLVSLLKDAYVEWDEERILDWSIRYWERARRAGLPVGPDFASFYRDFEWMGVQRHLKVLGIFARLCHRDRKPGYLADMPRVQGYLRRACRRYAGLAPILAVLDRLDAIEPRPGYTF